MRPLRISSLLGVALVALSASPLRAQRTTGAARPAPTVPGHTGHIDGVVTDSITMKPLVNGTVTVLRLAPEPMQYFSAVTDGAGHYALDTLAAGTYEVSFTSPMLDSLQVQLPAERVTLAEAGRATVNFAAPSGTTLRLASCPGIDVRPGTGAVVGHVTNLQGNKPLAHAVVAVQWPDLRLDPITKKPSNEMRGGGVQTDSLGLYRLCGVPTALHLLVQVQNGERLGSVIEVSVPDDAGVTLLDLVYSEADSRPADEVAATPSDTAKTPLTGSAAISGVVRIAGKPAADVQVQVVDAGASVRTDGEGHFSLAGLPGGTQLLEARKVGYRVARYPVSLAGGRTLTQDIDMARIITLDSVKIVAQRTNPMYKEFEERRRLNASGTFLRQEQIERQKSEYLSDMMRMYGFAVQGSGIDAKLYFGRGLKSFQLNCPVNVVIDKVPNQDINLLTPEDVYAMEIYKGVGGAPIGYDSGCGLVMIWTKR